MKSDSLVLYVVAPRFLFYFSAGVLTELDLAHNSIDDMGAEALASALRGVNGVLTDLNLNDNEIGDEGATALASALRVNEGADLKLLTPTPRRAHERPIPVLHPTPPHRAA